MLATLLFVVSVRGSIASSCTTAPGSSAELFSAQLPPSLYCACVDSSPRTGLGTSPCGIFVSSACLLRVSCVQVLNGEVKQHWSGLSPWATALMPGSQLDVHFWSQSRESCPSSRLAVFPLVLLGPCFIPLCEGVVGQGVVPATESPSHRKVSGWSDSFPLYKSMLTNTKHFLVHIMFGNGSYETLLPDLPGAEMTLVSL